MACTPSSKAQKTPIPQEATTYLFPYDLEKPDVTFELPNSLQEISGITPTPDGKQIVAIQDENGILFFINKATGKVEKEIPWYKDGDYEDVLCLDQQIYVIKSKGTLYELNPTPADTFQMIKHKTHLKKEQDVEGLCYDEKNNRLLLTCKGYLGEGEEFQDKKGVYAFDLKTKQLSETPVFSIRLAQLKRFLNDKKMTEQIEELNKILEDNEHKLTIAPSAIGIHPIHDHFYLLSSVGKVLVVIDRAGELVHIQKLKKSNHRQPEGIFFEADGTLFISNEGKKDTAPNIQRFRMN